MAIFLALVGAFFFGILSVLTRRALRSAPDAVAGAFVTDAVAFGASAAVAAITRSQLGSLSWHSMWPFLLAGFFVPGISQILFVYAIKLSGPSRTSTAVGAAPLLSAFIAIVVLGGAVPGLADPRHGLRGRRRRLAGLGQAAAGDRKSVV